MFQTKKEKINKGGIIVLGEISDKELRNTCTYMIITLRFWWNVLSFSCQFTLLRKLFLKSVNLHIHFSDLFRLLGQKYLELVDLFFERLDGLVFGSALVGGSFQAGAELADLFVFDNHLL